MTLLQASRGEQIKLATSTRDNKLTVSAFPHRLQGALRTVRKHTIGFTNVQSKVLSATENFPLDDAPFVALTHKFEIAQLSWDDDAFEEIVDVLKKRLMGSKWRRVVKALMVLHYCLQEGSGRFTV
ncbi:hypothetical protein FRB90_005778, partial [Tulasnella sp. 427]